MKTLYKKIIFSFAFISIISCKAQQFPLNTDIDDVPNYSYLKDLNNELSPYIGTYKANYEGNEIYLYITKQDQKLNEILSKKFYQDVLIVKFIIKNSLGQVLQDTQNGITSLNGIHSIGTKPNLGQVILYYKGTNCGVGWGKIVLKKLNATQISWLYGGNHSMIDDQSCPGNPDVTVYLPDEENLIFTKQ